MLINAVIEKDENGYFAFVPILKGGVSQGKSRKGKVMKKP
ncbi:hypothetical protein HPSA20_1059 [Helicobacter pylori SouthAfrica20]|uniref:Uncharacterized protein n=1 Tax=Helicobacter pylori SouthAfrica20 TaxID=1352356 RepID=T1UA70_HELPX|nr:hypothetical protein HPSA20_1059 [Helicobacter pylori SouthAfrica20]